MRAKHYQHRFGLVLIELMNYDWLLKEHGRNVAEKTLVLTGTRIKTQARDVDTAARVGVTKFVLLFEGLANVARVLEGSTHILARSVRPADALPVRVQLKLRLSMSLLPDSNIDSQIESTGEDAPTYLSWLIDKAQSHASAPNKTIRSINF